MLAVLGVILCIAVTQAENLCACDKSYFPICANGVTYNNLCLFRCAQKDHPVQQKAFFGRCDDQNSFKIMNNHPPMCANIWDPVCANNGVTYASMCMFNFYKHNSFMNRGLKLNYRGACTGEKDYSAMYPQLCVEDWEPICGSDGYTYANQCYLENHQKWALSHVSKVHEGVCGSRARRHITPCICTDDYNPVCGSDGVTYANACGLRCAQSDKPALTQVRTGSCQ